jgi:hypothetical protein
MDADTVSDRESETPQRSWRLIRGMPDALGDALAICRPGIEALFDFAAGLIEPLGVRLEVAWFDRDDASRAGYPPETEWTLADDIDRAALEGLVRRASDQQGGEQVFACPIRIELTPVRVRLPDAMAPDADRLVLGRKEGPASVAIERMAGAMWVTGPQDGFITPPVATRLRVDSYELHLEVDAHWTPWSEEGRPGTAAVAEAVARVAATGWEIEE